jgi:hypothetical protein
VTIATAEGYPVQNHRGWGRILVPGQDVRFEVLPAGPGFLPDHPEIVAAIVLSHRGTMYVDAAGNYVLGQLDLWMDLKLNGVDIADWLRLCREAGVIFPCLADPAT